MNRTIKRQFIIGIIFVSALGTLSHFLYEWSGSNPFIALFCPVNESTWEHMKLLFFPMLLTSFFIAKKASKVSGTDSDASKKLPVCSPVFSALLTGNLWGTFLIPVLFYSYSGILGYNIAAIDIAIFFVSVLAAFWKAYKIIQKKTSSVPANIVTGLTVILCVCFFIFTFYPPGIALFSNPL